MVDAEPKYTMIISRTTIDKLGVKLYDKVSAVVSELIANAYDADASLVTIKLPLNKWLATTREGELVEHGYVIEVIDDGHGMDPDEVNKHYLHVGKNPRIDPDRGDLTRAKDRKRLGRKGIGKLAPFGICKKIEVISAGGEKTESGFKVAHIIMDYDNIVQDTDERYPPDVGELDETFSEKSGTTIKLCNFLQRIIPDKDTIGRQIARRFGIELDDFKINISDTITGDSFVIGPLNVEIDEDTKIAVDDRPIRVDEETFLPVKGWVAYAKDSYPNDEVAGVRIYARGKYVANAGIFGLKSGFTGEYTVRSYLVGEIHADWLDQEGHEDLIRSDRQDILWSSEWGMAFESWGQALIKDLGKIAYPAKKRKIANKFIEISKLEEEAKKRFKNNPEIVKTAVSIGRIFGRGLNAENLRDPDYVERVKELSLSVAPHKTIVDKLGEVQESIPDQPLLVIAGLLNDAKIAESASLGMIVRERLDAIKELETILPDADEAELQKLLESAPWLIDPRWTMLQANQTFKTFRERFEADYLEQTGKPIVTSTEVDSPTRPDFLMAHFGKNLEIVEIKTKGHKLENIEFDRVRGYYERMQAFLDKTPVFQDHFDKVHVVLVCDEINLKNTHLDSYELYEKEDRLIKKSWDEILADTIKVNEDFLAISIYESA